jgi:glycosyltransferase involved in cell wall biosynthesis
MKRILIIPSWYPSIENPGLGTFFLEQTRLFTKSYEIKVLCGVQKRDISRLKKFFNTIAFLISRSVIHRTKVNYFVEPPEVIGFEYECGLNILRRLNYNISVRAYYLSALTLFGKWKFTLIHSHDTFIAGISAFYIYNKLKIPYIITEHNYLQFNFPSYINRVFIRALECSFNTLLVSEYQLRNLLMYGIKCRYEITGNFADDTVFRLKDSEKNKNTFNILFIARDAFHKDFDTLWKVIIEFDKISISKDYCFTIISNISEKYGSLSENIEKLRKSGRIRVVQFADRKDIISFFYESDVFLSTSIAESFGVGICEAMMCGIPVVSTNNGGFDEMYIPELNGIRTKIGDYKTLADSLYKIKVDEIVFNSYKIRESVIGKFGQEAFKSKMLAIYNENYE